MSTEPQGRSNTIDFVFSLSNPIWGTLRSVAEDYKDLIVPRTTSQRFSSNTWDIPDGLEKPIQFHFWDCLLPDGTLLVDDVNVGLYLFLKVRTFHLLEKESNRTASIFSARTVHRHFLNARNSLIPFLCEHNILCVSSTTNSFRSISNLTPSLFNILLDEIIQSPLKKGSKRDKIDCILKYLSEDLVVPAILRPAFDLCNNVSCTSVLGIFEDDGEGHEPIPDNDYFWIGRSALDFCHNYAETIIRLHELWVDICKAEPPTDVKAAVDNARDKGRKSVIPHYVTPWRMRELVRRMEASGVELPHFSDEHRRHWNVEDVSMPRSDDSLETFRKCSFTNAYFYYLFDLLFGSLCCLILIPTGMRNTELRHADISRVSNSPNQDGVFSYINAIKKIKPAATFFQHNEIPIPVETWQAMRFLDRLSTPLRMNGSSMICIQPLRGTYPEVVDIVDEYGTIKRIGDKIRIAAPYETSQAIAKFCWFIRSSTIPTPHRFRKSIAEFMLRKTKLAPLLISQLFGHKSVQMTLKYLKKSNLIIREMREYGAERFLDGAVIASVAYAKGAGGGRMIERIRNVVASREEFQGLTEAETALKLELYLMKRVVNRHLVILHTPLSLCCRSTESKDMPPCQSNTPDAYNTGLPDPSKCHGVKCDWAMTTFEQADSLGEALTFYKNMLNSTDPLLLRNTFLLAFAADFVETYDPIIDRIKKVPIEELKLLTENLKRLIKKTAA